MSLFDTKLIKVFHNSKKIDDILANWNNYENVIENAFNRSLNYTTEKFISKIQEDIDNDL